MALGLGAPRGAVIMEDSSTSDTIGEVIGYAAEPGMRRSMER
ncbi:hypothetical protein [Nordella sp. HKS 07]|nr:hypothetical protein [Nordella sp. HKS 07]